MAALGILFCSMLVSVLMPVPVVMAQEVDDGVTQAQQQSAPFFPLEIIIRPPHKVDADGFYENAIIETTSGMQLRFSGYYISGMHKRIIDGRMVYDVWQQDRNLLTHNIVGIIPSPNFEQRMAHELIYGNDIGARMGGEYKNMSFLEVAYSFNFDPRPPEVGFGGSAVYGDAPFNEGYSYENMMFGNISLIQNSSKNTPPKPDE